MFMKLKDIKTYLIVGMVCSAVVAGLASCRFEEDDYFNESASLRVEHAIDSVQNILVNAPQGWVMQYYANTGDEGFEGFNLFARFENSGKVTMASNHRMLRDGNAGKYTEATSLYEMLLEDGPVLAFNTWNDVLTPFVDPVDPASAPGSLVKDGAGMAGDHNFVIMSYHADEVILRGERYGAEVRLKKCDTSWEEYISATDKMKSYITNTSISNYYLTDGSDTLYMLSPRSGHFRIAERINDPLRAHWVSCCYTPDGFRLEHQDTVGTAKFQELTLAEDKSCLQNEDGSVKVIPCWDSFIIGQTSIWKMDPALFSTEQKSLYDQIDAEFKVFNSACSLESIGIGRSTEKYGNVVGLVFTFYTNIAKTTTNTIGLVLKRIKTDYGQMQINSTADDDFSTNMNAVNKRATNMLSLARQFAATLNGTYDITPNDYFLPTGGTFTAVNGGTTFKLN